MAAADVLQTRARNARGDAQVQHEVTSANLAKIHRDDGCKECAGHATHLRTATLTEVTRAGETAARGVVQAPGEATNRFVARQAAARGRAENAMRKRFGLL